MAEGILDLLRRVGAAILPLLLPVLAVGVPASGMAGGEDPDRAMGAAGRRLASSVDPAGHLPAGELPVGIQHRARAAFPRMPVFFEANQGQTDTTVRFLSRGTGYTLFLTDREVVLALVTAPVQLDPSSPKPAEAQARGIGVLRMKLAGAGSEGRMVGVEKLPGTINYFIGDDAKRWRADIPTYASVRHERVYPGVDLVFHGAEGRIEYDFVVAPGASPDAIALELEGAERIEVDAQGDLLLHIGGGVVRMARPFVYQEADGTRTPIEGRYALRGDSRVGFELATYDVRQALIIDPVFVYSRYLGGNGVDRASAIAVDEQGNAYVTGATQSSKFPVTGSAFDSKIGGNQDAFVAKLGPDGTLLYATYLGGGSPDSGNAIAVDVSGKAYVTGQTQSANFPTTTGSYDGYNNGSTDAFVSVLDPNGSALLYSTFLGGNGEDIATGVAVADGFVYVVGHTTSANFPTTAGAYDGSHGGLRDAFVAKLSVAGAGQADLVYSTFVGGGGDDIATGVAVANGFVHVVGETTSANFPTTSGAYSGSHGGLKDAFVAKLRLAGTGPGDLVYSTFLGASGDDAATGVAVDAGEIYVAGYTKSAGFPTTAGAYDRLHGGLKDAFVAKVNPAGAGPADLVYSTFLGGSSDDVANGIAVHSGKVHVTGVTGSVNFPPSAGAVQFTLGGGQDAFVATLSPAGAGLADLVYSTFLGGSANDAGNGIAIDSLGNIHVAGETSSANFPDAFNGLVGLTDAFVVKLHFNNPPILASPGNRAVNEGELLTFTLSSTDPDGQTVSYSIAGAASGMNFAASTGVFSWTPTEVQGPGTYAVTFRATDSEGAFDEKTITITVNEVNQPPVLGGVPASASVDEGALYTFTATATDPDIPANTLTFSLEGAPAGAAIDPATGVFTWTATEVQGPGDYSFTVRVTDNGVPPLSQAKTIAIHVNEVNGPPVLIVPGAQTVAERSSLTFTVSATDPEGNLSLLSATNLPPGATFDAVTGTFAWTPTSAQGGPNPYIVYFTVSDGQSVVTKTVSITARDTVPDPDGDGIPGDPDDPDNSEDNCPEHYNPDQVDVCHSDPGATAASILSAPNNTTDTVNVTVTVTFSGGTSGIYVLSVNLFTAICRVIDGAGHELTLGGVPEGPPVDVSAVTFVAPGTSLTSHTTFDLRLFYPNLVPGSYTVSCDHVSFAHDPHREAGDNVPWMGVASAPPQPFRFPVHAFSGFTSPLPGATFSQTKTVPVKFALKDSAGAFVSTCNCTLTIQRLDAPDGTPIPGTQVPATPTNGKGDEFRYDHPNNQYVFNVSGKSLPLGPVQLQAHLDDGTLQTVNIIVVQ